MEKSVFQTKLYIKMNNVSSLPPTAQNWSQNTLDKVTAILHFWSQTVYSRNQEVKAYAPCLQHQTTN